MRLHPGRKGNELLAHQAVNGILHGLLVGLLELSNGVLTGNQLTEGQLNAEIAPGSNPART